MTGPERMPVWKSADKIRVHWLTGLCAFDALYGVAIMFGKSESAPQVLLRGAGLPPPFWGFLLFVGGVLIWFGWSAPGGMFAVFSWGFQCGASLVTISVGTAASYGGPIFYGFAAYLHAMVVYEVASGLDKDREHRQRRE